MQALRSHLLVFVLAALLLSLVVPTAQQGAASSSEGKTKEAAATEAPFAKGAKSEASDDSAPAADQTADKPTPSKQMEQPAAPAPAASGPTASAASKPKSKSKIVEIAPEADVQNEVDDIDVAAGEPGGSLMGWASSTTLALS